MTSSCIFFFILSRWDPRWFAEDGFNYHAKYWYAVCILQETKWMFYSLCRTSTMPHYLILPFNLAKYEDYPHLMVLRQIWLQVPLLGPNVSSLEARYWVQILAWSSINQLVCEWAFSLLANWCLRLPASKTTCLLSIKKSLSVPEHRN